MGGRESSTCLGEVYMQEKITAERTCRCLTVLPQGPTQFPSITAQHTAWGQLHRLAVVPPRLALAATPVRLHLPEGMAKVQLWYVNVN